MHSNRIFADGAGRRGPLAAALLLTLTLAIGAAPARAAEFPKPFWGLWINGNSCAAATGFALFAADFGLSGVLSPGQDGKFTVFGFDTGVIRQAAPNRLVTRFPFPGRDAGENDSVREIREGRLYSSLSQTPDRNTVGFRCGAVASANPRARGIVRLLRRLDRLVRAYSDLEEACRTVAADAMPCAKGVVALLDLNGDGKVAPAEVTAFLRRYLPALALFGDKNARFRGGFRIVAIEPDDLSAIEATAAVFGPFITNTVFSNFDYDGKGFLTADEIALTLKEEGLPGGAGEAIRMLSDTRDQAEEALGALGGVAGGMLGQKSPGPK